MFPERYVRASTEAKSVNFCMFDLRSLVIAQNAAMVAAKLPVDDKITARVKQICLLGVVCKVTRSNKKAKADSFVL